jgi:hypothetical protein
MIQRFNEHSPWPTGTLEIIKQFVPGNVLFLEQDDITTDHTMWKQRLIQIETVVKKSNIQKILIDCTLNPEIIDKMYNTEHPTRQQCITDLNQICKTYYVTGDYSYYYHPEPQIVFFPAFLWTIGSQQVDEHFENLPSRKYKTIYKTKLEKTKSIMCFNRNLTWHRLYLFSLLAEQSWFDKITYSFLNKIGDRLDAICIKEFLDEQEREKIKSLDHLLPINVTSELGVQKNKIPLMWMDGASSVDSVEYRDHAINLVTETSLTEGIILTEKTCKPFLAYQIPIILGPIGANKFLRDIGLDMFEDYVPWQTWDNETDHKLKMQKIVSFLDQLLTGPTAEQDILLMHQQMHPRLVKNKQRFHSQEFLDLLTRQLNLIP